MAKKTIVKNFLVLVNVIVFITVASCLTGCTNHDDELFGDQSTKTDTITVERDVPVFFDITENDTLLLNEEGTPIPGLRPERLISKLTVDPEEVTVDKDTPWALREESIKVPNQNQLGGKVSFEYNHGEEVLTDSFYVIYKNRELPFFRPKDLRISEETASFEETSGSTHKEESYTLTVKGIQKIFAKAKANLNTQIGYKPSFECLLWGANHIKGTAKASYDPSKANIIVTCTDTLWAKAKWDNGEYKDELSTYTHSRHSFNVQISGTESVASINAIVGKDMSVSGNKATYAEVTLTLTEILNEIVEKNISYTYDGKTINWIDSLHYCRYQLDGAKYTTSSNVHVVLVRKSDNEKVSVDINKPLTEKEVPADVDVEILRISITDSYTNQHSAQEGTYLHIFGKKSGNYVALSQRIGGNNFQSSTLSDNDGEAILASGRAIAYVFNGSSYQIGTVTSEDGKADKGFYLRYYVADGRLAYSLGSGTATEALKDGFRDAIRGSVSKANADGTWTVTADGKTYTYRGL